MQNIIYNVSNRKLSFRAAHITDIHFLAPPSPYAAVCADRSPIFKSILDGQLIDYILNTGDSINDSTGLALWNTFKTTLLKPTINTRGNHDGAASTAVLGMPSNYFYQDIGDKWRAIVLYSQGGGNYSLGATQTTWLSDTLAATPTDKNVCIMSHVPILGVAAMMWYLRAGSGWSNTVDYHSDSNAIINIFKLYPNVKVCLSGHEHTIDKVEHEGITYLCSGAVCANWWHDTTYIEKGYPAGYRLIDFYDDGTIREKFFTY